MINIRPVSFPMFHRISPNKDLKGWKKGELKDVLIAKYKYGFLLSAFRERGRTTRNVYRTTNHAVMSTNGLKSSKIHPYMKKVHPFWRHSNLPPTLCYSDDTKDNFERFKFDFENNCKYVQWSTRSNLSSVQ